MASIKDVGPTLPPRKKIKTSDLPLSSATRSAIDDLTLRFKKEGHYDGLRKQVWDSMSSGVSQMEVISACTYAHNYQGLRKAIHSGPK